MIPPESFANLPLIPGPLAIQKIQVMHGASYFSGGPVIKMRLDLGEFDEVFTNEIPGFYEKLKELLPSLYEHQCSEGYPGGFFVRVEEGTLLGHVTEHTAIELQTLAGMDVAYGKTRQTTHPGVYNVVFRFFDEVAGVTAARSAVNLINAILTDQPFNVEKVVEKLVDIREKRLLGPTTQAIVNEAKRRGIPHLRLDTYNLVQLGTGCTRKWARSTLSSDTGFIAVETAQDKPLTLSLLKDAGIPVPPYKVVSSRKEALACYEESEGPLTLTPVSSAPGIGKTPLADSPEKILQAFDHAVAGGGPALLYPRPEGEIFRITIIGYAMAAACRLIPPAVTGDGEHSVEELVEELNRDPRRGPGERDLLTRVVIDEETLHMLAIQELTPETIPPRGTIVQLKAHASLKNGAQSIDVTDRIHPVNRLLAERACRAIGLNAGGVELITRDITVNVLETKGCFTRIYAAPDLRMHLAPTQGEPRPVAAAFVKILFPEGLPTHIPLISVTGTRGKTLTVHLLDFLLRRTGLVSGMASSRGLKINGMGIMEGKMTEPEHVALLLKDPTIECAVVETSCEGILRRGLGYEYADVGIVLNVLEEHEGNDDITRLDDIAYAQSVVAEQVLKEGVTVLNADNPLVMEMAQRVDNAIILFSKDDIAPTVLEHIRAGGRAVALDRRMIVLLDHHERTPLLSMEGLPIADEERYPHGTDALLAAIAALWGLDISLDGLSESLASFEL